MDTFLRERGLRLRGKYVRENSLRLLIRVLGLEDELKQRALQPREWVEGQQTTYNEEEPLDLSHDGEFSF